MILADKIIKLRKQFGWSQEELAEKMNVSRQSVSKWESANSIPDLNKILQLSEIFGVSTDYLIRDEIEEATSISEDIESSVVKITLDQAMDYVDKKVETGKLQAIGTFLTLGSIMPLLFLLGLSNGSSVNISSNTAVAAGLVLLFALIAIGVSFYVRSNQYEGEFVKFEKEEFELVYGVHGIIKEKLKSYKSIYQQRVSLGVMMFMLSFVPLLVVALMNGSGMLVLMMVDVMLAIIALGIFIMVPVTAKYTAYSRLISENDFAPHKQKENKKAAKLAAFYFPMVIAIYVGWSLWTMAWGTTWIIWPVASIAFAGLTGLMNLFEKEA